MKKKIFAWLTILVILAGNIGFFHMPVRAEEEESGYWELTDTRFYIFYAPTEENECSSYTYRSDGASDYYEYSVSEGSFKVTNTYDKSLKTSDGFDYK